ncbi:host-nuclease inhibitor Gam family protein [Clostridium estertheticum]|uniref:host-nuclease inhibitor Gam family protein n=1 Tax=Clostridium estertheticum TaxID=238834 RepID=UPI001C0E4849|nr:host-nuclease inhibitor Gam family protein [Clostridium estertheticum]MBU3186518.1 host-nuclease inhibitor Gam family protein [Clostridium estertheticum]
MESKNLDELFLSLFGSEEEQNEVSEYKFESESDVDESIGKVKDIDSEITRFKELYDEKLKKLDYELESKLSKLNNKKEWLLYNLKNSVMAAPDKKDLKSMYKKVYFAGEVQIKKATTKLIAPEFTEKQLNEDYSDYKKVKTVTSLDWAKLKGDIKMLNGTIINEKTGEILTDIIPTEITAEKVVVK